MDTGSEIIKIILIAIVGIVLFSFMMYQIIWNASYGRKIWRENVKQTNLLIEIAKREGVEDEIIDEILEDIEPVKPVE